MNPRALSAPIALLLAAAPSLAQPPPREAPHATVAADDAVAVRDAKARFDEGLKRYAAYDYEGAWAAFAQAYAVLKSADVLWNLCMAELRSGRPLDAIRHVRVYLKDARITEADRARARKYLAEAHQKTAHMLVEVPAGALVFVDGASVDRDLKDGDPVDVAHGRHKVECRQGSATQAVDVDLVVGQTVSVRFVAATEGQPAAEPTVTTVAGREEAAPAAPESPSSPRTALGVGLAAGAVVALGVGIGFVAAAGSAGDDAARLRGGLADPVSGCYRADSATCRDLAGAVGDEVAFKNVSTGALVAAGVLAAGSAAVLLFWPSKRITPQVGPGGAGVHVAGSF